MALFLVPLYKSITMSNKTDHTASFMVRFNQNIFEDESGESNVQWRGQISHVQGGDKTNFTEISDALQFMQGKLAELTKGAMMDKTPEEQEGILTKSFYIWKKMAMQGPKMVMDVIKDPKNQISQFQDQIIQVGDELSQKMEIDSWRSATKSDFKNVLNRLDAMSNDIAKLSKKVSKLSKSK